MVNKLKTSAYNGQSCGLPDGLVEIHSVIATLEDGRKISVESLFHDIIASGVEVWRPPVAKVGRRFVVRQHVADAIDTWFREMLYDDAKYILTGYAGTTIDEYLRALFNAD